MRSALIVSFAAFVALSLSAAPGRPPKAGPAPHHAVHARVPAPRPAFVRPRGPARPLPHPGPRPPRLRLGLPVYVGAVIGGAVVHAVYDAYYVERVWVSEPVRVLRYGPDGSAAWTVENVGHWKYRKVFFD